MNDTEKLKRYVAGGAFERALDPSGTARRFPFVTISRQAGAGGHALAEALLRAMAREPGEALFRGWEVFDQALCERVASDPQLKVSLEAMMDERFRGSLEDFMTQFVAGLSPQLKVYHEVFRSIRSLAAVGKAIIVGRAAACFTRDLVLGVHVRVVASREARILRLGRRLELPWREAERKLEELERSRRALVRQYFQKDIEDPLLYDAVWNTDAVPIDAVARAVLRLARERAESEPVPELKAAS